MRERLRIAVRGAVQGVGFRPFVYRLARDLRLDGWVTNTPQGVVIEVEGPAAALEACLVRLERERPAPAIIQSLEPTWLDPVPYSGFEIRESASGGETTALVLPDIATCPECRADIADPANRRYRYPFTNCTNCGPRFSIIESLPYDRPRTSMRAFTMCPACLAEYHDPADRRFHAQPNACPVCGPQLALWNADGAVIATADDGLREAARAICAGLVVAVKGLGGFHLVVDAANEDAVRRLRARKHREEKPFALMFPALAAVEAACEVSPIEARLLTSSESPIVLLRRRSASDDLAPSIAPRSPSLGVMLPYTPLHLLLLAEVGGPVVATSGNLSDEPICTAEREALARLSGIADLWLVHDRPILRHVDDSIVRVLAGRELVLRRARGYAPLPVPLDPAGPTVLAVGGHLKNTVALTAGGNAFISQHIGDLETGPSTEAFRGALVSLERLFDARPELVAADRHPDYRSTQYAASLGLPVVSVQHHHAHVAACAAENGLEGRVLGVAWDGTGYGTDGTIWGGEFLMADGAGFTRLACLRPFRLPGGDRAVREPRRSALGALHAIAGRDAAALLGPAAGTFTREERTVLLRALDRGVNAPITTSAGRLFDAAAALAGLADRSSFEGQAAMALEWAADPAAAGVYPFGLDDRARNYEPPGGWEAPAWVVDWGPALRALTADLARGTPVSVVAMRFHRTLAEAIVAVASRGAERRVVLSGGCFQNRLLAELAIAQLRAGGFTPYWHQRVPPNDGGIALGQLAVARQSAAARERTAVCASPFPAAS
jgi:hydrogenase maturation protein HypF